MKNGLYGYSYKGYYITKDCPGEKKSTFSILDTEKNVLGSAPDWHEAEWQIDKRTASHEEMELIEHLYQTELYVLSRAMMNYMRMEKQEGLTRKQKTIATWVVKVRGRRADEKPL